MRASSTTIARCVDFGLVNETMHKIDERVPTADLVTLTAIYRGFLIGISRHNRSLIAWSIALAAWCHAPRWGRCVRGAGARIIKDDR